MVLDSNNIVVLDSNNIVLLDSNNSGVTVFLTINHCLKHSPNIDKMIMANNSLTHKVCNNTLII